MKTEDIIKHLQMQDRNLDFYKKENEKLKNHIEDIMSIKNIDIDIPLVLKEEVYTKDDILDAYNKTLKYEGLSDRSGGLILDTMISFLNKTHHSLK